MAAAVGLLGSVYLDGIADWVHRMPTYFPEGPWRTVSYVVFWIAIAALVLSAIEVIVFWFRPERRWTLREGSSGTIEETLEQVRKELQKCMGGRQPDVPRGLDILLRGAMVLHSSDVHFNPLGDEMKVNYRVDGVLHEVLAVPTEFSARLTTRLKVLSRLETYSRKPQDGVLRRTVGDIDVEARVSVLPANYGERVVLRLVRGGESIRELADIGFSPEVLQRLQGVLDRPQGIVLVSGPVGSGKTTTLYSALEYLNRTRGETTSLVSLEDPIELQLPFVTQTQMNPKVGMTFAQTLRSALRQDPGALMVGEIRDRESAEIATQAGLTGHLILSTLHVQSAAGTFTRLMEMGIEPYILASSCTGALAQRLVRGLCEQCKVPMVVDGPMVTRIEELGERLPVGEYFKAVGCPTCENRGYVGRLPIAEMLVVTESIMNEIRKRSGSETIHTIAKREGMETLLESGLRAAARGQTSIEEVLRVAG